MEKPDENKININELSFEESPAHKKEPKSLRRPNFVSQNLEEEKPFLSENATPSEMLAKLQELIDKLPEEEKEKKTMVLSSLLEKTKNSADKPISETAVKFIENEIKEIENKEKPDGEKVAFEYQELPDIFAEESVESKGEKVIVPKKQELIEFAKRPSHAEQMKQRISEIEKRAEHAVEMSAKEREMKAVILKLKAVEIEINPEEFKQNEEKFNFSGPAKAKFENYNYDDRNTEKNPKLVFVHPKLLGFDGSVYKYEDIEEVAEKLGLSLCPKDTVFGLFLNDKKLENGAKYLIATDEIAPSHFTLIKDGGRELHIQAENSNELFRKREGETIFWVFQRK